MHDDERPSDNMRQIESLLSLASWYRAWAARTDSKEEKERRLEMAAHVEQRARELAE